jgi:lysozyme
VNKLDELLIRHEEKRYKPYLDCCGKPWRECRCLKKGKLTGGIGRNMDAVPFSEDEIQLMYSNDKARAVAGIRRVFPWFDNLNEPRAAAVISLVFNMGLDGFRTNNPKAIAAMAAGRWEDAANELLDGPWKGQVGQRAYDIADIVRTGEFAD